MAAIPTPLVIKQINFYQNFVICTLFAVWDSLYPQVKTGRNKRKKMKLNPIIDHYSRMDFLHNPPAVINFQSL